MGCTNNCYDKDDDMNSNNRSIISGRDSEVEEIVFKDFDEIGSIFLLYN